jgi:adenosine deaminase
MTLGALIDALPKAELHVHLEGTLEPEMAFALAERNGIPLPYGSASEMRRAYSFHDLQSFLDVYYAACSVLVTEQDFYEVSRAYLARAAADGVRHVEPFFDPQTHLARGVAFATVVSGISRALAEAAGTGTGISSALVMCFRRDLPAHDAERVLDEALAHRGAIRAVGLDSSEIGNPPGLFAAVFARAREAGLRAVAHAGEEGPPSYIADSIDLLRAERIDHGVRCLEDPVLTARLARDRVCLTVCPLSNVALKVVPSLAVHPLKRMLDAGLSVTVNSDDPAYFGGYISDNYREVAAALELGADDLVALARNAIEGSFATSERRAELLAELDEVAAAAGVRAR